METLSRRQILLTGAGMIPALIGLPPVCRAHLFSTASTTDSVKGRIFRKDAPRNLWKFSTEARFYKKLKSSTIMCTLCPNQCVLRVGDRSICRSRVNMDGKLFSIAYGNPCSVNVDPVEKKPLFHFKPATRSFSIACAGCNFRCLNCQNWEISQAKPEDINGYALFPEQVVEQARHANAISIAYTYSEPTTFFEYMADTAIMAKEKGLYNIWVSNGFINPEPLSFLCELIDGANVNLKAYSDDVYRALNGGRLEPVLNTFKMLHDKKVHFEITNLVVPGYTDDDRMMKQMVSWILKTLGPDHPLHFLRFFPQYRLDRLRPTSVSVLSRFRATAMDMGIKYVYVGNVPGHEGNHTFCHACGKKIVERNGYSIARLHIRDTRCEFCDTVIPGVW